MRNIILKISLFIPLSLFSYIFISFLLSFITTQEIIKETKDIEIYIISNTIHTEFLVPVTNDLINWSDLIESSDYLEDVRNSPFMSIGWGDKRFYFEMPTWNDLTLELAISALFLPTESVIHFDFYNSPSKFLSHPKKILISKRQYIILIDYIKSKLVIKNKKLIVHKDKNYSGTDNFYKAKGNFHLFNTCNMWTNNGLKKMGIKTSVWSPFKYGVLKHL